MSKALPLSPYVPRSQPQIPGGSDFYVRGELQAIAAAISTVLAMTPQVTTKAPTPLVDGMIRLARSPFYPVSGQTADAWVFYDAKLGSWHYLDTTTGV